MPTRPTYSTYIRGSSLSMRATQTRTINRVVTRRPLGLSHVKAGKGRIFVGPPIVMQKYPVVVWYPMQLYPCECWQPMC